MDLLPVGLSVGCCGITRPGSRSDCQGRGGHGRRAFPLADMVRFGVAGGLGAFEAYGGATPSFGTRAARLASELGWATWLNPCGQHAGLQGPTRNRNVRPCAFDPTYDHVLITVDGIN